MEIQSFVNDIKSQLGVADFISLHEPKFKGNESKYVQECISTGWVSSVGKFVDQFEADLGKYIGCKKTIAIVNGTSALSLSLKLAGVAANDEVIVPALSFVATANAVSHIGAIPHFVDVSLSTMGMCPEHLKNHLTSIIDFEKGTAVNRNTGRKIAAIVPMHTFGHPVDMDPLIEMAAQFQIPIVEDAAESLGSFYKDKHTGNFGLISALSFNGNKIITTGGGGAICTNDTELGNLAKHLSTTAKKPHPYNFDHDQIGYNYRLPNINAALGVGQLEHLESYLKQKRKLHAFYCESLKKYEEFTVFSEPANCRSNYWLINITLRNQYLSLRDPFLEQTNKLGFMTRPSWKLLNQLDIYKAAPTAQTPNSIQLEKSVICIPSSPFLAEALT